jgi:hypothetical protein
MTWWCLARIRYWCGIRILFIPIPIFPHKTEYWLECEEGAHGIFLMKHQFERLELLDSVTASYLQNEISEDEYTNQVASMTNGLGILETESNG